MTIEITSPEIEALIQRRLRSGAFESVEHVLSTLWKPRRHELWLQENKEAIQQRIERGLAQLDRGERIPGDQLRARLAVRNSAHCRAMAEDDLRKI